MADRPEYPGAPRWVKIAAVIAVLLILILALLFLFGEPGSHGPGRHLSAATGSAIPAMAGFIGGG